MCRLKEFLVGYLICFMCSFLYTEIRERNANFGSSLLLANSPMSPKIVNGSFAAIFDNGDKILEDFAQTFSRLRLEVKDSPGKSEEAKQKMGSSRVQSACRLFLLVSCLAYFSTLKIEVTVLRNVGHFSELDALQNRKHMLHRHSSIIFIMYGNTPCLWIHKMRENS